MLGTHTYTTRTASSGASSEAVTRHLTFPYQWRLKDTISNDRMTSNSNDHSDTTHNLRTEIITKALQPQAGIEEHTGTIYIDTTIQKFARMDWEL